MGVPPNHPFYYRIFLSFNHGFWGTSISGNHLIIIPMSLFFLSLGMRPRSCSIIWTASWTFRNPSTWDGCGDSWSFFFSNFCRKRQSFMANGFVSIFPLNQWLNMIDSLSQLVVTPKIDKKLGEKHQTWCFMEISLSKENIWMFLHVVYASRPISGIHEFCAINEDMH